MTAGLLQHTDLAISRSERRSLSDLARLRHPPPVLVPFPQAARSAPKDAKCALPSPPGGARDRAQHPPGQGPLAPTARWQLLGPQLREGLRRPILAQPAQTAQMERSWRVRDADQTAGCCCFRSLV